MAENKKKTAPKTKKAVSTAAGWKAAAASQGVDLEVHSGNVCRARNVGMQVFLEQGMIPNSLMAIVRTALKKGEVDIKLEDVNEEQIKDMLSLFDAVTVYCVVEPKVSKVPHFTEKDVEEGNCDADQVGEVIPSDQRDPEKLFVDEVDMEDKQFIFQWVVGGTSDLAKFRREEGATLERLRDGADVEPAAK